MTNPLKLNTTVEESFKSTGETWEESGSLIYVYKCNFCHEEVNGHARHIHLWFHKYQDGFDV